MTSQIPKKPENVLGDALGHESDEHILPIKPKPPVAVVSAPKPMPSPAPKPPVVNAVVTASAPKTPTLASAPPNISTPKAAVPPVAVPTTVAPPVAVLSSAPKVPVPQATLAATEDTPPDANIEEASAILPPHEVNYLPPLVQSFVTLFGLRGRKISGMQMLTSLGDSEPTLNACRRAAEELGLNTSTLYRANIQDISSLTLPCMLLMNNNHSCLLLSMEDATATVILPEHGTNSSTISLLTLQEDYSGNALFASLAPKADRQLRPIEEASEKRWFWDVVQHFAPLYKQVALISVMTNLLIIISPLFVMNVYDRVVPNLAMETLWALGIGVILGYILELIFRSLRCYFIEKIGTNIDTIVATRIMRQILGMKMEDRPTSSGALMNHMREFDALREFCSATTLLSLVDMPFLLFFLGIVGFIGGFIVLVPLIAIIALILMILGMQRVAKINAKVQQQGQVEKSAHMVEMITGMEAIKMASAEHRMLQLWEKIVGHCAIANEEGRSINTKVVNLSLFCTHIVSVGVIITGVYLIGAGSLTVGGLIACNMLSARAMSSVVQSVSLLVRYQQVRISARVLDDFMELPQESNHNVADVAFEHLDHSIEFTHVYYAYKDIPLPTLRDLTFTIRPGAKLGVIGAMGSGKSTLSKLMVGLYLPSEGSLRFGGVDLRQLNILELRNRFGYMPQEPMLFHGSVRDNIALGAPNIPDQLILRAAYLAGVTDFVKTHPAGFGLQVGERGQNLSCGQRQAISLARALVYDPDVLILDEPTSNMDGFTEQSIKSRLMPTLENKTLIINMHRTTLLSMVDDLLVLKNGTVFLYGPKHVVLKKLQGQ